MTLAEVNSLDEARFVALLGGVFERSPWVARRASQGRPFESVEEPFRGIAEAGQDQHVLLPRSPGRYGTCRGN